MGARGPRSSSDLATRQLTILSERRPAPPEGLTEAEQGIWKDTIGAMPSGWLSKGQLPLLKAYVQHVARAAMMADQVNRFRPEWIKTDEGLARLNRLMVMAERESKAMASMARILRLAPSAQYGPRKGATINAAADDGPRPWDPEA